MVVQFKWKKLPPHEEAHQQIRIGNDFFSFCVTQFCIENNFQKGRKVAYEMLYISSYFLLNLARAEPKRNQSNF